jgi:tRNA nucleotidyltransferase (CCA-adding enzyme)
LWDPYNGLDDLKQKRLRVLHQQSFQDDATRIFRAARFAVRLNCDLEWRTSDWLHEAVDAQYPLRLSGARLREELLPFFREPMPGRALKKLDEWKALSFCLPGFSWEPSHDLLFDRFIHRQTGGDVVLKNLLVLFHHESLPKVKGALAHMMFPSKLIGQIEQALLILRDVRDPQFSLKDLPPSVFKQLVPEVRSFLKEASELRSKLFRKKLEQEFERYEFATPVLTGDDLTKMGYSSGPMYHKMLQSLRSARWEGKLRTRQEEIQFIQNHFPVQS